MWTLTASATGSMLPAMLLADLAEFVSDHRACGTVTADATEPVLNAYLLAVGCSCGVGFTRWVTPEAAVRELLLSELITSRR
jgi:hypothetical protein